MEQEGAGGQGQQGDFKLPDAFAWWAPKLLLVLVGEVPITPLGGLLPSSHPTEFPGGLLPCTALPFLHIHACSHVGNLTASIFGL